MSHHNARAAPADSVSFLGLLILFFAQNKTSLLLSQSCCPTIYNTLIPNYFLFSAFTMAPTASKFHEDVHAAHARAHGTFLAHAARRYYQHGNGENPRSTSPTFAQVLSGNFEEVDVEIITTTGQEVWQEAGPKGKHHFPITANITVSPKKPAKHTKPVDQPIVTPTMMPDPEPIHGCQMVSHGASTKNGAGSKRRVTWADPNEWSVVSVYRPKVHKKKPSQKRRKAFKAAAPCKKGDHLARLLDEVIDLTATDEVIDLTTTTDKDEKLQKQYQKILKKAKDNDHKRKANITAATPRAKTKLHYESGVVLDSGATNHMTGMFDILLNPRPHKVRVILADGSSKWSTHKGTAELTVYCKKRKKDFTIRLKNCLYLPDFRRTLWSVPAFVDKGRHHILFRKNLVKVKLYAGQPDETTLHITPPFAQELEYPRDEIHFPQPGDAVNDATIVRHSPQAPPSKRRRFH